MSLSQKFKQWFIKEQFQPSFWGLIFNPYYYSRQAIYQTVKKFAPEITGQVLDIGCGSQPYRQLFPVEKYIGIDTANSGHDHGGEMIDLEYDGQTLPLPDQSFDAVVCFEVLEHVFNPAKFLTEINRVLRPGGKVLITVPFVWLEHEQPYDFARYSSFGLRDLFTKHGFKVIKTEKYLNDARVLFLLINAYIISVTKNYPKIFKLVLNYSLTSVFNILGLLARVWPKSQDLYFGNIFLLEK